MSITIIERLLSQKISLPKFEIESFPRNNNFNFLRLLFAYNVVVVHSIKLSESHFFLEDMFVRNISVSCFFIISGFLTMRSYWASNSIKEYAIKRCKRLLPAYYLMIFLCVICGAFFSDFSISEYFKSPQLLRYIFANITFLNFLEPSLPGLFSENNITVVNGSLWTIKLLVCFYLFVPILSYALIACKSKKRINVFLIILYFLAYLYKFFCMSLFYRTDNSLFDILAHQLPSYIQYFAVGIFCFINYDSVKQYNKYLLLPAILFLYLPVNSLYLYLLPIALASIIMFFAFNFSTLNNLGRDNDYSYGIYIYHFPIIQVLVALGYFELNKNITLLIVLAAVFSVSFLSWHFLEKKVLGR